MPHRLLIHFFLPGLLLGLGALPAWAQENNANAKADKPEKPQITDANYRLYHGDGTPATFTELLGRVKQARVTFLGEDHVDPVGHFLEARILREAADENTALSLEMFERDVQLILDEYLAGVITEGAFREDSRPWPNYKDDYRPLVEFAKEKHFPVIAANAPRRYVNRVSRLGTDSLGDLSSAALTYLPPLVYAPASAAYAADFREVMSNHGTGGEEESATEEKTAVEEVESKDAKDRDTDDAEKAVADQHEAEDHDEAADASTAPAKSGPPQPSMAERMNRALEAQNLWDASMANAISLHLRSNPEAQVIHVTGSFHVSRHLGTPEHLARYSPDASALVVVMMPSKDFPAFDAKAMGGQGDFVIVTDPSVKKSPEDAETEKTDEDTASHGEDKKEGDDAGHASDGDQ